MTKNQDSMISYVLKYLSDKEKITEATIQNAVKLFLPIVPLNDSEQTEVIKELQSRLQIDIDRGSCTLLQRITSPGTRKPK